MALDEVLLDEDLLPVFARARIRQSCDANAPSPRVCFWNEALKCSATFRRALRPTWCEAWKLKDSQTGSHLGRHDPRRCNQIHIMPFMHTCLDHSQSESLKAITLYVCNMSYYICRFAFCLRVNMSICVLPKSHMLGFSLIFLSAFILILVLAWHFVPSGFVPFYSGTNKHTSIFISVFYSIYTTTSVHSFKTSHTTFNPYPRTFSSVFCLSGTSWVSILEFYLFFWSS
jgi:hypothetical protein